MAVSRSKKRRIENVIETLKHDKAAIISIIFLIVVIILSLAAPFLPLEPNKTDIAHMLNAPSVHHWLALMKLDAITWPELFMAAVFLFW